MLTLVQRAALLLIFSMATVSIISVISPKLLAEEPPGPPAAPLPAQIIAAKRVFISNGGEDTWLDFDPKHDPTLTYNEFYADMKSWGKYELVSSPADSDVVFEIHLALEATAPILRLRILDPKSHIVLWPINQMAKVASRDATARKNFDEAMNTLIGSLKKLVASSP
jgi:hypothetical protein